MRKMHCHCGSCKHINCGYI